MGNSDSKVHFRKAIVQLTSKATPIDPKDEFWDQFWSDTITDVNDVFELIPATEIRTLREESPANLATLVYKCVEKLVRATDTLCNTTSQQTVVLNSCRLLTRLIPYLFEDPDWRGFFWSNLTAPQAEDTDEVFTRSPRKRRARERKKEVPLAHSLLNALSDLLFCPDFTVPSLPSSRGRFGAPDCPPEDLQDIDSCEYIWASGVGFTSNTSSTGE